jgi:aspartyl-tRNA synthetase
VGHGLPRIPDADHHRSSPEGARDFLVPSRLHPGRFYALPQAPQQFKQLLMVSGFDKYFQIAPCFRDEDPRADRSPTDFYQLDMEMSFVEQEDVFDTIEPVIKGIFDEFGKGRKVDEVWPRISYRDAALWYGTDKPDLRNPMKMQVVSEHFAGSGFAIFAKLLEHEGTEIRAIPAPGGGSRKFCDRMNSWAQKAGPAGDGLYLLARERGRRAGRRGAACQEYRARADRGDPPPAAPAQGRRGVLHGGQAARVRRRGGPRARRDRARAGADRRPSRFAFAWIVDFPMYEKDEETGRVDFSHNPFSMPQGGMRRWMATRSTSWATSTTLPATATRSFRAPSGTTSRDHVQGFELAGYGGEDEVRKRFGGMVNAFRYGAPPHGGCAAGIDRIVMLLADDREHPRGHPLPDEPAGRGPDDERPSEPTAEQLMELGLRVIPQD